MNGGLISVSSDFIRKITPKFVLMQFSPELSLKMKIFAVFLVLYVYSPMRNPSNAGGIEEFSKYFEIIEAHKGKNLHFQ